MLFPLKDVQVGVVDEECVWHNAVNAKIFRLMKNFYGLCAMYGEMTHLNFMMSQNVALSISLSLSLR